jgi:hypothetical protein
MPKKGLLLMKTKGIKVKRGKSARYSHKNKNHKGTLKIIFFVLLLLVLIFLGYSILAPILDVMTNPDKPPEESETPAVTTDVTNNAGEPVVTTTAPPEPEPEIKETTAFYLPVSALADITSLNTALDNIPKAPLLYNTVVVPLKSSGGSLNYATTLEIAIAAKSNKGTLTLSQIYNAIENKGYTPVAEINLLQDHIYPLTFGDTSYILSGGSRWYDNAPDKGGKPWLSPFAVGTKTYLQSVTGEVNSAGFKNIIFSGAMFPPFRQSDMNQITAPVKDPNRYTAITDLVTAIIADLPESNPAIVVKATDIFKDTDDVLKPDILSVPFYVEFDISSFGKKITVNDVSIDISKMTNPEKLDNALTQIRALYPNLIYTPVLSKEGLTDTELAECDNLFDEYNLTNRFIQ